MNDIDAYDVREMRRDPTHLLASILAGGAIGSAVAVLLTVVLSS